MHGAVFLCQPGDIQVGRKIPVGMGGDTDTMGITLGRGTDIMGVTLGGDTDSMGVTLGGGADIMGGGIIPPWPIIAPIT